MGKTGKTNTNINTMTIPIRILGKTTSITLKKHIISLWILLMEIKLNKSTIKESIVNFVYECSNIWNGNSAKGFSDFVTEQMLLTFLEKEDLYRYNKIKKLIREL